MAAPEMLAFAEQLRRLEDWREAGRAGVQLIAKLERMCGRKLGRDEKVLDVVDEIQRKEGIRP